jgi:hypothetical protein
MRENYVQMLLKAQGISLPTEQHPEQARSTSAAASTPHTAAADGATTSQPTSANRDFVLTTYNVLLTGFEDEGDPEYHDWRVRLQIMANTLRERVSGLQV